MIALSHISRAVTVQAFYLPNKDRPNLTVMVDAHVYNILTKKAQNGAVHATGVSFAHDGGVHNVHAKREVIICAGYG